MGLMEKFVDPEMMQSLSVGERVIGGLITTLMGMGITFLVLLLLWGCISVTSNIIKAQEKKNASGATDVSTESVTPQEKAEGISGEVIAVITAAIAACEGPEVMDKLVVRRISRVSGSMMAWNAAGRNELIEGRKI